VADLPPEDGIVIERDTADAVLAAWDPWSDPELRLALCGAEPQAPFAFFSADTLYDMLGHGRGEAGREVGGILVGTLTQSPRGPVTRVNDIIIADTNQASLTHVTFTHESWDRIYTALDGRDDGVRILGWYHTHPGFGPFLSAHDRFIQENFFSDPAQVALVLDPVQDLVAVFGWRVGQVVPLEGCFFYDQASDPEQLSELTNLLAYGRERVRAPRGPWARLFRR
jgi:proteasome lid subunit RPN8/RPN11